MANVAVWFDIPASDVKRAETFYSAVLNAKCEPIPGMEGFVLPHKDNDVSGCIFKKEGEAPASHGVLLYLSAQGRLDDAIAKVVPNGGKVLQPKHPIGPYGFRAVVLDSEGNRIALHSM